MVYTAQSALGSVDTGGKNMFITPAGYENEEGSGGEFNSRVSWNSTRLLMAKDDDGGRYGASSSDADAIEKALRK